MYVFMYIAAGVGGVGLLFFVLLHCWGPVLHFVYVCTHVRVYMNVYVYRYACILRRFVWCFSFLPLSVG